MPHESGGLNCKEARSIANTTRVWAYHLSVGSSSASESQSQCWTVDIAPAARADHSLMCARASNDVLGADSTSRFEERKFRVNIDATHDIVLAQAFQDDLWEFRHHDDLSNDFDLDASIDFTKESAFRIFGPAI